MRYYLLAILFYFIPLSVLAQDIDDGLKVSDISAGEGEELSNSEDGSEKQPEVDYENNKIPENSNDENSSESDLRQDSNTVVLRGLNKVVGRSSIFEVTLGTLVNFESLEIIARKCIKSAAGERPENESLLEIHEIKAGEAPKQIFLGWMFSSSPSLSSFEHPVYDITVISCETRNNSAD